MLVLGVTYLLVITDYVLSMSVGKIKYGGARTMDKCPYATDPGSRDLLYFPDAADCNCYFMCDQFRTPTKMCCPKGLWWDQASKTCIYSSSFSNNMKTHCITKAQFLRFQTAIAVTPTGEPPASTTSATTEETVTQGEVKGNPEARELPYENTVPETINEDYYNQDYNQLENADEGEQLTLERYYEHTKEDFIHGHCAVQPNPAAPLLRDFIWGSIDLRQSLKGGPTEIRVNMTGFNQTDDIELHGFHVHEFGDLSRGCESAGPHYDPFGVVHGGPKDSPQFRHFGDLGNIREDSEGQAIGSLKDYLVSLLGPFSVLGRAFVIHETADDLGRGGDEPSLTSGNAGARIACCTVGLSDSTRWPGSL